MSKEYIVLNQIDSIDIKTDVENINLDLNEVRVVDLPKETEDIVVKSKEEVQIINPPEGKFFKTITVDSVKLDKPDQSKTVKPTTKLQSVTADVGYELSECVVEPVTYDIDSNIIPENIKQGVNILGVTGTHKGGMTEVPLSLVCGTWNIVDNGDSIDVVIKETGTIDLYANGVVSESDMPFTVNGMDLVVNGQTIATYNSENNNLILMGMPFNRVNNTKTISITDSGSHIVADCYNVNVDINPQLEEYLSDEILQLRQYRVSAGEELCKYSKAPVGVYYAAFYLYFDFFEDGTYEIVFANQVLKGEYTYNETNGKINLSNWYSSYVTYDKENDTITARPFGSDGETYLCKRLYEKEFDVTSIYGSYALDVDGNQLSLIFTSEGVVASFDESTSDPYGSLLPMFPYSLDGNVIKVEQDVFGWFDVVKNKIDGNPETFFEGSIIRAYPIYTDGVNDFLPAYATIDGVNVKIIVKATLSS